MARKLAGVVFAVSTLHTSVVHALGLGEIELKSTLNEPLIAEIAVVNTGDLDPHQLSVKLAGREAFARAGVERVFFLNDLEFAVKFDGRGNGVIVVTSDNLVREPYLDFVLEARWPEGQMNREYTLLVDLPTFSDEVAVAPTQASKASNTNAGQAVARVRAPAAARSAAAALPAAFGGEITTRRNDTLWGLALKAKPAEVSEQQAMMAIYRKNPDVFDRGNINGLMEGKVVRLPEREEYDALSRQQAIQSVAEHNSAWSDRSAAPLDGSKRSGGEPEVVGGEESYMKLSSPGAAEASVAGASGGTGQSQAEGAVQSDLIAAEEKLESAERENAELNVRLDELQEQLATLEKLVELKDEKLASLQTQLGQEPTAVASAPAESGAAENAPVEAPVVSIEEAAEPGLVGRLMSPLYLGLGGGLLALGAFGTVARRRRKEEEAVVAAEEAAIADEARASLKARVAEVTATDAEQAHADEASREILATLGDQTGEVEVQPAPVVPVPSTGDAVAEAEIYCSYGRYDEAIAMLKQAIEQDPSRAELHMTLLGILAEQDRREPFQAAFADLQRRGDEDSVHLARHMVADKGWLDDVSSGDAAGVEGVEEIGDFNLDLDLDLDLGGTETLSLDGENSLAELGDELKLDLDNVSLDDQGDSGDLEFNLHLVDDEAPQENVDLGVDADALVSPRDGEIATFDSILNAGEPLDPDLEAMFKGDEIGTKLDLARAYVDMGDVDGARDILDEVIQEGSDGQKQEANELLNQLAG